MPKIIGFTLRRRLEKNINAFNDLNLRQAWKRYTNEYKH